MRLDKLRGYGPWLAYASPACLVLAVLSWTAAVAVLPDQGVPDPRPAGPGFYALAALTVLLLALWMVTLLAVAVDLEWIEHPLTHTQMTYVALAGAAVGTLAFLVLLLSAYVNFPSLLAAILGFAWLGGIGTYLVVINLVGRRARVLTGALPWIGAVAGALDLLAALLIVVGLGVAIGFPLLFSIPLYIVWSIWLGFQLRRPPAGTYSPANQDSPAVPAPGLAGKSERLAP